MLLLPPRLDAPLFIGMLILAVLVPISIIQGFFVRKTAAYGILALVMGVSAGLAQQGLLADTRPAVPAMAVLIALSFGLVIYACTAGRQRWLLPDDQAPPIARIVGTQIFRLPLELLMLRAALLQIMPREFSLLGYNWDVLTGILAGLLVLALRARPHAEPGGRRRRAIALWNAWGILCLLVIATLAVLSSPQVHALGTAAEHINSWVLFFPYVWLPVVLVPMAVFGHIETTRWLLRRRRQRA